MDILKIQTNGRYQTNQIREIQLQSYVKFSNMYNNKQNDGCDLDGRTDK